MGRTKATKMPYENKTTYQEWTPSETADLAAVRGLPAMPESLAPNLQAQYDRAQELSNQRWSSAYGASIPEVTRRAMQGQEQRGLGQDYMSALQDSAFQANNANFQRRMMLAELTLGRPLQSGQSGFQSAFAPPGFWQQLALNTAQGAGQAVGAMAM
jgi:hypothetical protein